jgi:hypothetical protein
VTFIICAGGLLREGQNFDYVHAGLKGGPNAWSVDMLQPCNVYVSDHFGCCGDPATFRTPVSL